MGLFHRKKKPSAPPARPAAGHRTPPESPAAQRPPAKLSEEAARELAKQLSQYMKEKP